MIAPIALLRHAADPFRRAAAVAVAVVYPPSCVACGRATGEPHGLCAECWKGLRFIERPYCERLGTPFAVDHGMSLVSPAAIADPPVYARARAVARYDETARTLIHRLKYGDRLETARALGRMLVAAGQDLARDCDAIVPVPLHRVRLWQRRYNQAMELARPVGAAAGKPVEPSLLRRVRHTTPQVGLSRNQRGRNLQGAFKVPPEARPRLEGRRILLVDDVITTGATANAAARALLRGGAAAVDILAFARVVPES
ncbi:ComF family protein [Enterovirga rhinocerotis]|uniref:ComF family protein n=1 Tax=Enterovirga rhinocerotis TaxID=1339210 RepID=A0A4R7C9Q0_9HYPH|nr:ComF family protein [Enterovirga rhinocerotis]TDR95033.1 ComF family protein [Enterovirga rhinocerotis]